MMPAPLVAIICALWLLAVPPALAQSRDMDSDARARHLYRNGEILYAEGRYADAIAAWQSAYKLSDRPLLLYNMANAQERLGRWEDALRSLNRYRAFAPKAERDVLTRRIANLERNIRARNTQTTVAQPEPVPAPRPAPRVRRQPVQSTAVRPSRTTSAPATSRIGKGPIALFVLSGFGAVTGTFYAYRAGAARAAAAEVCKGQGATYCPTSASPALNQDQNSSIASDVGFGVALVGVVAGTAMVLTSRNKTNRTTMSLAPAVGGASLGLSSRF